MMAFRDSSTKDFTKDEPPNSRLFILCQKGTAEQDFRDAFEKYGHIEDIWIIKDKRTNEDRGIVYIKYAKTSEAMLAMDEMNGRNLSGSTKALKVVVANSKRDGSSRDPKEEERLVRLFIIVPKHYKEDDLREEFSKFGDLESITILKDRSTGESKGFGYIRYYKPVHAAKAYEDCNSLFRAKFAKPHRSKDEREENDHQGHNFRFSGAGQKRHFEDASRFGGDPSGGYRPLLPPSMGPNPMNMGPNPMNMGPNPMNMGPNPMNMGPNNPFNGGQSAMPSPLDLLIDQPTPSTGSRLIIQAPIGLTQSYLSKLFNLYPGMEYCDLNESTGVAFVRYNNPQWAALAKERLNGFEYPLGNPIQVQMAEEASRNDSSMNNDSFGNNFTNNQFGNYGMPSQGQNTMDSMQKQAAMILEKAGINPNTVLNMMSGGVGLGHGSIGDGRRVRMPYSNIPLPQAQPTVPEDGTNIAQRLFIVCQPSRISEPVLKDAFCRFGNLINVHLLPNRNYGYAKFASKDSAMKAIETLHGQTLAGQRLKVMEAEPPKSESQGEEGPSKKQRL